MEVISHIVTAFGISAPAGLNAYLTLLLVGLTARFTDLMTLRAPFDLLENEWLLTVLLALAVFEFVVDKIPGLDTANDIMNTVIRPVAGAVLFASSANAISDLNPVLGGALGLVVAGSVHLGKSTVRPPVQAASGGIGGAFLSLVEDLLVIAAVILAIMAPLFILAVLALAVWGSIRWLRRRRRPPAELASSGY